MSVRRKTTKVKIIKCTTGRSSGYYSHVGAIVVIDTTEQLEVNTYTIWFKVIKVIKTLEKGLVQFGWIRKGDFIVLNEAETEQKRVRTIRIL